MTHQTEATARSKKAKQDRPTHVGEGAEASARDGWRGRHWVPPAERVQAGKAARKRVPREDHATFEPKPGRDPIAILGAQEQDRLQDLVPLRHARMAESAFAYYRGTPAVLASDLADTPRTDIVVQASGDAHLSNFGLFASPERALVFDANDFDETLPGPWEWDVKRLAASVVISGRANGYNAAKNRKATMSTVRGYRRWMARYAAMRRLDVLYASLTDADIRQAADASGVLRGHIGAGRRETMETIFTQSRGRNDMRAFNKLTAVVDGRRVINEDPPVMTHVEIAGGAASLERDYDAYRATLPEHLRDFLDGYRFVDFALKVVGVGSVGTRCYVIVLEGRDEADPFILQMKEATASVLEPYLGASRHENHAQRVVVGQRLMQGTSDIFLGWLRDPQGRDFYIRQLWDMKGSVDTTILHPSTLAFYGSLCGWALARGHARTGDAVAIATYLGQSDAFDGAIADFAETYADVNARDHARYVAAIKAGQVSIPPSG